MRLLFYSGRCRSNARRASGPLLRARPLARSFARPLARCFACLALLTLAPGGCTETVSFLTIDLELPSWSPAITCEADPRRAERVRVTATCGGQTIEGEALVSAGSVGLEGLPMSECEITVSALNKHGRVVLEGEGTSTVLARGANESLTIKLLQPACDKSTCDTDGDGVPDHDEKSLGTDLEDIDSDGDGIQDGLELVECCTDPVLASDAQCSKFLIQGVYPGLGPVGTAVLIRATSTLKQPAASVGTKALDNLFADSTIVLGQVAKDAVLGEVVLTSDRGASRASYDQLFAVLKGQPELVTEISQRAKGITPPMYQLVDQAFVGKFHFLLGASAGSTSSGGTSSAGLPILIQRDRSKPGGADTRVMAKAGGQPLGLAASAKLLVVLTQVGGVGRLSIYPAGPGGAQLLLGQKVSYPGSVAPLLKSPLGLRAEPSGDTFQLLTREVLFRFKLDANGAIATGAAVELRRLLPGGKLPGGGGAPPQCTGGVFYQKKSSNTLEQGSTYLSCNKAVPCPAGKSCPPGQGYLVRVPASSCLKLQANIKLTDPNSSCGASVHLLAFPGQALGAPVVDPGQNRLFVLSSRGVVATAADKPGKLLGLHVGFDWRRKITSQHLMTLSGKHLFVVDGQRVRRLEPYRASEQERQGMAFPVGRVAEEATMLTLAPDGTLLSVGRRFYGSVSSLMGVCLKAPCGP